MSNPYETPVGQPHEANNPQQTVQHMVGEVESRQVQIRPLQLLKDARDLLGEQYWLFVGITLVGILIGSAVPFGILLGPMLCGIHLCFVQRRQGKPVEFAVLFKGFDHFAESLIATLVFVGVSIVVLAPLYIIFIVGFFTMMGGADGKLPTMGLIALFTGLELALVVVMLVVSLPFTFVFPLIAHRRLKAMSAIKASFQGAMRNVFGLLGMMVVYAIIGFFAALMCYLPVFLFLPLSLGAMHLLYEQVFEPEKPVGN